MTELHETFRAWLVAGAREALPRDVALHASACPECLRVVAAFDALAMVDPGAAPDAPAWAPGRRAFTPGVVRAARTAAGLTAVALIAAAGFVAAGAVLDRPSGALTGARESPQGEGVLGDQGGPASSSPTPSESASATASMTVTPSPGESAEPIPQDNPPMGGGPPPISTLRPTPTVRPATLEPSSPPTPRPPTPAPTVVVTPVPTPVATPVPTAVPTAVPDDCADTIDNDGDLLIDVADPGCLLDGNESSA